MTQAAPETSSSPPTTSAPAWRVPATALGVIALVVVDVRGDTTGAGSARFLLVLAALYVVVVARTRDQRLRVRAPDATDRPLLVLLAFGMTGSVFGILFRDLESPSFAVFVPLLLGFVHVADPRGMTSAQARVTLKVLSAIGVVYTILAAGTESGVIPSFSSGTVGAERLSVMLFRHEKAFLLAMALTAAWMLRRRALFVVLSALAFAAFLQYPAATYAIVAMVSVLVLLATSHVSGRKVAALTGLLVVAMVVAAFLQVTATSGSGSIKDAYFSSVGKGDNSDTRGELWQQAIEQIGESPVWGNGFTGNISLPADLSGRTFPVPPHNDLLQIGMGGGVIAMALLVLWIAVTNKAALRVIRAARATDQHDVVSLARVLLIVFNGFFTVAMFNPVLVQVGLSAVMALSYTMLRLLEPVRERCES